MGFMSRLKQRADEKFGDAEKTEIDPQLVELMDEGSVTEEQTKILVSRFSCFLQPNPKDRLGDAVKDGFDAKKAGPTYLQELAEAMTKASEALGSSKYAKALLKVSEVEAKVATAEREFLGKASRDTVVPLKRFIDNDMKTMLREKKNLSKRRLDLDAAKSKARKASEDSQQDAEASLKAVQDQFDQQTETTKALYEKMPEHHEDQRKCLKEFVKAQAAFYEAAYKQMKALSKEL